MKQITIGIVDDHQLFSRSLGLMLESFNRYRVLVDAKNGRDLQQKMSALTAAPEMMLIDVNMPVMDGIATAAWLPQQYPAVTMVALSMNDDDKTIIGMIKAGCCAYLLKDTHPDELEKALDEIYQKGYYNAEAVNVNYRRLLLAQQEQEQLVLTQR